MSTVVVVGLLCGSLLLIFGGLLGHTLGQYLMAGEIRRQARLARDIGEQWRDIQAERAERDRMCCQHCGRTSQAADERLRIAA